VAIGWKPDARTVDGLPLGELRERFGIDAIWITEVADWSFDSSPGYPFRFALSCTLVATRSGERLWSHEMSGEEATASHRAGVDPFGERDPFEADDPVRWNSANEVLDSRQLATLVAQNIGARLPLAR
jgi:hypothetical protein